MIENNNRWVDMADIFIPTPKTKGFESEVLVRDIWDAPVTHDEVDEQAAELPRVGYLVRMRTGEKIPLGNASFTIGKGSSADYKIEGNSAISRIHAQISVIGGSYYITDMGSANHTFVDETPVTSTVKLHDNAVIRMADEDFIFHG